MAHRGGVYGYGELMAVLTRPGRDAVPPPYLPGDAPVPDIVHPLIICPGPGIGYDSGGTCPNRGNGLFRQGLDPDKPLPGQIRLYGCPTSIAMSNTVLVRFHLL